MNLDYIKPDDWKIIEEGFNKEHVTASESIFSIGNGAMGQRANFEEDYSGDTFQGSYIGGIYYPDKTRVGWWKNGYPEYFAKVLNAPNWIGIGVKINGKTLDLNSCKVIDFSRELDMRNGVLTRSFIAEFEDGDMVKILATRFLSMDLQEVGVIKYSVTPINFQGTIEFDPYLDAGIMNEDSNYDEFFWEILDKKQEDNEAFIISKTLKTGFQVCTGMKIELILNDYIIDIEKESSSTDKSIKYAYKTLVNSGDTFTIVKYGGYTQSMNHPNSELYNVSKNTLNAAAEQGFDQLFEKQQKAWDKIWDTADITITGDMKAQQAIRFNIFQLNQTYSGDDSRLNIGPKGFTGEKYGGSTYWDTEAYCIPFYMSTKDKDVARNLLLYRYNQLDKAIENAEKLGFTNGAALYPMVTMNGEECHNEWEITFEEIHRNGAMVYAIYNYVNYSGDYEYVVTHGMEVILAIARFWSQRATLSGDKDQYVILGVTGPNEYENNINNNWYTNYLAKWCLEYALENLEEIKDKYPEDYVRIIQKVALDESEIANWTEVADRMYFPYSEKYEVFLQQDGFLDKELVPADQLSKADRPINQNWSWDRILRSPYIKQADVLQGFYFFENLFELEALVKHFDFYEPLTVHESSLSPCVHSILAAKIGRIEKAYEMYLRTSRLDLDDYNHEVHEGLHITSMAGTWLSIVQGFGGMRNFNDQLSFDPVIPKNWKSYSFKIKYRDHTIKVFKNHEGCKFYNESDTPVNIIVSGKEVTIFNQDLVIL
ncbi:glycoside hydrolase family 65 protein [Lutimonas saemankumensis]|uniref:glycoside hydrolase family 65 protein n=1 Tax=Lutimonas saemankumensis TaxID=483016 RepID=UPI001CD53C13|nr:glycoside hydrolase family 65 protein [Lutimonas saemankumensis]MCA0932762.1 glycoside hydrolase family 65 protein [Lutimonas saemankumensis]